MLEDTLTHTIDVGNETVTIVRPGLSLSLLYDRPLSQIGGAIAQIFLGYLDLVPEGALQTYLANDGYWKPLGPRTIPGKLKKITQAVPGDYWDFYFGQLPEANVGHYGAAFNGVPTEPSGVPDQCSMLILEFPFLQADKDKEEIERIRNFAFWAAGILPLSCGYLGYAFKHPQMTFRDEAYEFIAMRARRFLAFDISDLSVAFDGVGKLANLSWITFLGPHLLQTLGGAAAVRAACATPVETAELPDGLALIAAAQPPIGDVNRGATDCEGLLSVYKATAAVRQVSPALSLPQDEPADFWQRRFERLLQ